MCRVAFPIQWKQRVLTFQICPRAVGNCGWYMYTVFFRNFWAFSLCAFFFSSPLKGMSSFEFKQPISFALSAYTVCTKLPFFFSPCTCDELNKESLHEHRELWQRGSKQKLIKTPAKKDWLMFIYWKLPPCKGVQWRCQPEKMHHGDGDWDGRCSMVPGTAALSPRW